LSDGGGLYLEVAPAGGKYWRFKYRFAGKEKRISLGVYGDVSLAEAREQRDACRKQLAKGIDPGVHRKAQKAARASGAANSFEVVAREWLKEYIDPKSEGHRKRVYARFENDIFPYLGGRPIAEIDPAELLEVIRKIEKRDAKDTARRTLGSCGQVFRHGVGTGRCKKDITADLRGQLKPVEEQHFAAVTTPAEIGGILRAIDSYRVTLVVQCAFRLAPLVFVRPGELRTAKWKDIDLDDEQWTMKISKRDDSKPRRNDVDEYLIVPLPRQAMEIPRTVHALTGDDVYVFPGAPGCQALFPICTCCDRGQRYCSQRCRVQARVCQHRAANRRHQQSVEGRLDHRDRQKRYRRRHHTKSVTDQGSQTADPDSPSKREQVIRLWTASPFECIRLRNAFSSVAGFSDALEL
jgi:integrase